MITINQPYGTIASMIAECVTCGEAFTVKGNTTGKYCSADCWYAVDRSRPCPVCGEPFKGPQKTCSKKCGYQLIRQAHPTRVVSCENCGEAIIGKKPHTRFCSRSCSMYARIAHGGTRRAVGTRTAGPNGYIKVRTEAGWEFEHRVIMGEILRRPLKPWPAEHVHHRDGNRANNTEENLELRTGHTHGAGATKHCPTCTCEEI